MRARRVKPKPHAVKQNYSYSVSELARCCGVHKNTVRNWRRDGLEPIDKARPVLFHGMTVRAFLRHRKARRTCPSPPGTMYCVRCRQSRRPALGMVQYRPLKPASGNLSAICETCEAIMHRGVRKADLTRVMPNLAVQIAQGPQRLCGRTAPSLNCD